MSIHIYVRILVQKVLLELQPDCTAVMHSFTITADDILSHVYAALSNPIVSSNLKAFVMTALACQRPLLLIVHKWSDNMFTMPGALPPLLRLLKFCWADIVLDALKTIALWCCQDHLADALLAAGMSSTL